MSLFDFIRKALAAHPAPETRLPRDIFSGPMTNAINGGHHSNNVMNNTHGGLAALTPPLCLPSETVSSPTASTVANQTNSSNNQPDRTGDNFYGSISGANVGGTGNRNLVNNNNGQEKWEDKLTLIQETLPSLEDEEKILQAQLTVTKAVKYVKRLQAIIDDVQPKIQKLAAGINSQHD